MVERLWIWILMAPGLFKALGRALMFGGVALAVMGVRGHRALALIDHRLARVNVDGPQSLAQLYPTLPTWWIPEGWVGYSLAACLFVAGAAMASAARTAHRLTR